MRTNPTLDVSTCSSSNRFFTCFPAPPVTSSSPTRYSKDKGWTGEKKHHSQLSDQRKQFDADQAQRLRLLLDCSPAPREPKTPHGPDWPHVACYVVVAEQERFGVTLTREHRTSRSQVHHTGSYSVTPDYSQAITRISVDSSDSGGNTCISRDKSQLHASADLYLYTHSIKIQQVGESIILWRRCTHAICPYSSPRS